MKNKIIKGWLLFSVLYSLVSFAKIDPVSWRLIPAGGFPVTQVGGQSVVTYMLTSHLPRPAVIVTVAAINGPGMTVEDGCNNVLLNPNQNCFITVKFAPTQAGLTTFKLIYGYHNNRIPLPLLVAAAQGGVATYSLGGAIPNFPSTINPTGTVPFFAVFQNNGTATLTGCYAGNILGTNQFTLNPATAAQLTVTRNRCGTVGSPLSLAPGNFCTVSGTLSAPFQSGPFSLSALMNCDQAASSPTVHSTITQSMAGLTGVFTVPFPFPTTFYDNQAPFVTALFTNTGNVQLTNCQANTSSGFQNGFSLTPSSAGTVVTTSQPSTCGTSGSPRQLNPGESCNLYGQMTGLTVTSSATLTASVLCTQGSASPQKTFSIQHNSGSCTTVTVAPSLPLPSNTYKYADNVVQFQITNTCVSDSVPLDNVTFTAAAGTAIITQSPTYDTCSSQTLTAGSSCLVSASVIPTSIGPLTIQANVTPAGGVLTSGTTSSTAANNQTSTHHLFFVNQCNFDVWYGIGNAAGSSGNASPDPNLATFPNGAPPEAYHLPAQVLGAPPSTIDLSVSSYINGALWPRTGCTRSGDQLVCATGNCITLPGSTPLGSGTCVSGTTTGNLPQNPITKIEATLTSTAGGDGVYDVSVINGMTVPVEIKAFGPLGANQVGFGPGNPNDVYTCSSAGAIIQPAASSLLSPCSWSFNPSSSLTSVPNANSDFYWVTPGNDDGCSTSTPPLLCGMAANVPPPAFYGTVNRRQGDFLGFSTLANYIGYTASTQWGSQDLYTIYGMGTPLTGYGSPDNYTVMLGCIYDSSTGSANSCYQSGLTSAEYEQCCGCVNWTITTPDTPCGAGSANWPGTGTNALWTTDTPAQSSVTYTVQQGVTWLKQGCPTAYAYQFDDPSSSFQCNTDNGTPLNTSYIITFCPGGVSGLPAGTTDGRSTAP